MRGSLAALLFLFLSGGRATTFKSGTVQAFGKYRFSLKSVTNAEPSRPQNAEELFNIRHSSARNVVERIFGVLKWRFRILVHPPQFSMDVQARLPPALAALHNFIRQHDPDDMADVDDNIDDPQPGTRAEPPVAPAEGQLAGGIAGAAERRQANERRDKIAQEMWTQYQAELLRRMEE